MTALRSDNIVRILNAILKRSHFLGAISYKELPQKIKKYPFCVVINSAAPHQKFGHWTAIFCENENWGAYFDSLGIQPWGEILSFINRNISNAVYNRRLIQHPQSQACGYYCIIFLKSLDSKDNLSHILGQFEDDTKLNDTKVVSQTNYLIENLES